MPVFIRIKQSVNRARSNAHHEDAMDAGIHRGVLLIVIGIISMTVGVMVTIFGITAYGGDRKTKLIAGPCVIAFGLLCSIIGGILYGVNYRRRLIKRQKQEEEDRRWESRRRKSSSASKVQRPSVSTTTTTLDI